MPHTISHAHPHPFQEQNLLDVREKAVVVQPLLQVEERLHVLARVGPIAHCGAVRVRQVRPELADLFHAALVQRAVERERGGAASRSGLTYYYGANKGFHPYLITHRHHTPRT